MDMSVLGCRSPSVKRHPSSALRSSGSAAVADGDERARMLIAERFALQLQRLAQQGLSCGEIALVHQRHAERPSGGVLPLTIQQEAEEVDGGERVGMPIAERIAPSLERLA
eukprot:scaffold31868_cov67-Phaeocystis_antarctica.AAC.3